MSILKEFKEHSIELVGAVLLKWKYEANHKATTREEVIADATQLMNESINGWDIELEYEQEIYQKDRRIAELEAELASLKDQTKAKWVEAYSRICPDITQEGEGELC